jgi:hypothetical protein
VTFGIYAGMHLFLCLPIHLPVRPEALARHARRRAGTAARDLAGLSDPRLRWLTLSFAVATFIFAVIAVHLISLLTTAGLTPAQAVSISMLVGPMQVAGRIIELGFAGRVRAVTVGVVAFSLMLLALVALISVEGFGIAAVVFVIAYGCGNGVLTIVKGTAPVELFGRKGLGGLLGPPFARRASTRRPWRRRSFSALLTFGLDTQRRALRARRSCPRRNGQLRARGFVHQKRRNADERRQAHADERGRAVRPSRPWGKSREAGGSWLRSR